MTFSKKRSMAAKIISLALGAAAVMALTYVWVIPRYSDSIYAEKRSQILHLVESSASVIQYYVDLADRAAMSEAQAKERALAVAETLRYDAGNYFWILDMNGTTLMHPFAKELVGRDTSLVKDAAGKPIFSEMAEIGKTRGSGFLDYVWQKPGETAHSPKFSYVKAIPQWNWVVGTGIYVDDVQEQINNVLVVIIPVVVLIFLLTAIASVLLARTMTSPLRKTLEMITEIAQGKADLTARLRIKSADEIGALAFQFNKFIEKLHEIISQVLNSADLVQGSTMEISQGNQNLSERVQQQASAIQETASVMEEMTSAVQQEAEHARQANSMAQQTSKMAKKGGEVIQRTIEAMGAVTESSKKINEIISVVNEIAFQTNLLALNAAVEAARAGEAGRGFAVVAGEVRNLAGRSAKAAKEIQSLITDSVSKVEQGNALVDESGKLLSEIIDNVQEVAVISSEIDASIQEQATGIEQVSKAINQMDEVVQQNATLVEEAASASEEMASAAASLRHQMSGFKIRQDTRFAGGPVPHTAPKPAPKPLPAKPNTKGNGSDDFFESGDLEGFEEF